MQASMYVCGVCSVLHTIQVSYDERVMNKNKGKNM